MAVSLIEKIARDIADALGDNFDYAFNSKPEWTAARGETKAGFRDVNQPFKSCYLDAAQAALTAIMGEGDGVQQCDREAAASGYFAWCSGNPVIPDKMKAGQADVHSMVQAFARHRATAAAAERARRDAEILAWLREQVKLGLAYLDKADNPNSERNYAAGVAAIERAADAIERGEV